jgi:hypothetical protein
MQAPGICPLLQKLAGHSDRVACHLHHPLIDKEGERGFSVPDRHLPPVATKASLIRSSI